jgi:hypothetical protein
MDKGKKLRDLKELHGIFRQAWGELADNAEVFAKGVEEDPEFRGKVLSDLKALEGFLRMRIEDLENIAKSLPEAVKMNPEFTGLVSRDDAKLFAEYQESLVAGDIPGALEAMRRLLQFFEGIAAAVTRARMRGEPKRRPLMS